MLNVFKFNYNTLPPMTMESAIEFCRERALSEDKSTSLYVELADGTFLHLADYEPIPARSMQLYRSDPKDTKSAIVPQVQVTIF